MYTVAQPSKPPAQAWSAPGSPLPPLSGALYLKHAIDHNAIQHHNVYCTAL